MHSAHCRYFMGIPRENMPQMRNSTDQTKKSEKNWPLLWGKFARIPAKPSSNFGVIFCTGHRY